MAGACHRRCFLLAFFLLVWSVRPLGFVGKKTTFDYDLVVIGAGASGGFAASLAASLGSKTLVIDQARYTGGDCSNAACVPSKAIRSIAKLANPYQPRQSFTGEIAITPSSSTMMKEEDWSKKARKHADNVIQAVRYREDPSRTEMPENMELLLSHSCHFVSKHELCIVEEPTTTTATLSTDGSNSSIVSAKHFLIATGASPIVPDDIREKATEMNLPIYTYRDILPLAQGPPTSSFWSAVTKSCRIVVAGGGPTACELSQSLARLGYTNITIVSKSVLSSEDARLQQAAMEVLVNDGIQLQLGRHVVDIFKNDEGKKVLMLSDTSAVPVDSLLLCLGRQPSSLASLALEAAGVDWNIKEGILVHPHSLRSKSVSHVYASGDCCSAVHGRARKATQAGYTGYHAARNICLPRFLWMGSKSSVHPIVPSVTFTDPELACVGLTRAECVQLYGRNGFQSGKIREEGSDRADMDRMERPVQISFMELRVCPTTGLILGLTVCSPVAAETANEVGLAIQNKLTVSDLARSMHSYPSHGYLLYRLALSMTLSDVRGSLEALGPIGSAVAKMVGFGRATRSFLKMSNLFPQKRRLRAKLRDWEAEGEAQVLLLPTAFFAGHNETNSTDGATSRHPHLGQIPVSFLEAYSDPELQQQLMLRYPMSEKFAIESFSAWVGRCPHG